MKIKGVMAMALVQDIERATRFYREILGFSVQSEAEDWVVFEQGVGLQVAPEALPEFNLSINSETLDLISALKEKRANAVLAARRPPHESILR